MSSWQSHDDAVCDDLGVIHVSVMAEAYTDDDIDDNDDDTDDDNDDEAI